MDNKEYFEILKKNFDNANMLAALAKKEGIDPKPFVEIKAAPDIGSRVEGIIGIAGLAKTINDKMKGQTRSELAFEVTKEICTNDAFAHYEMIKRIELATKVGLAILTEGILVAPTEGLQEVRMYKNPDNTDYIAVMYAGPIRGAGGTAAALSVALADYARRIFNIGPYKPTQDEIDRYVEEVNLYDARAARLQYKPPEEDLRFIAGNCPVCVDGVASEDIEVSVHRDIKRKDAEGKTVFLTNRVRGGVPLVLCEGIAQKAKKIIKEVRKVGLDWEWLNNIIRIDKMEKKTETEDESTAFLSELVAGRPILAYPGYAGGFRLRYGRSRFSGIAAMGFSPATMILTMNFIAVGTQLKMHTPRKGCIATPVDSIEGPFVRLKDGRALRVNDAALAEEIKNDVEEIIYLGDILIAYGDFRNANTMLLPSSYVEDFWKEQLKEKDDNISIDEKNVAFDDAYALSSKYGVPIHPKYLYEFGSVEKKDIESLADAIIKENKAIDKTELQRVQHIKVDAAVKRTLELLAVPHEIEDGKVVVRGDYAKALLGSLGFLSADETLDVSDHVVDRLKLYENDSKDAIELVNKVSAFPVMKRSTFIAARVGRPEKAKERLMKPPPNVLFPIGEYGGKERNIIKAYNIGSRKFDHSSIKVETANYMCKNCKRLMPTSYCYDCQMPTEVVRKCIKCGAVSSGETCDRCGGETSEVSEHEVDIVKLIGDASKKIGVGKLPSIIKGVKGLSNKGKKVEPIEKGILRSLHGVYIFKDGTARFDATDAPLTHFYPAEIGTSIEKLNELGYDKDYLGNKLASSEQLVELKHQDVILNMHGAEYLLKVANFVDEMLEKLYRLPKFYNAEKVQDLVGQLVITLSPHTSCGVLGRIIGFTDANVGLAHPYTIAARRRNCDGDEDTTMLLLDALINFSKEYLPNSTGGTMDAPIILMLNVVPEEVDDEVHMMDVTKSLGKDFYYKTLNYVSPNEVDVEIVKSRLDKGDERFRGLNFTYEASINALKSAPKRGRYSLLNNMQEKVDTEFKLMDMIYATDSKDAAKKLLLSHFIPDIIGNLHTFSKQTFRCSVCNAKYRRVPLSGVCPKDGGKLLLTVSKGNIEKYLSLALNLANKYDIDMYIKQRLKLIKDEIENVFSEPKIVDKRQFSLNRFV